jgi:hypothetical protein
MATKCERMWLNAERNKIAFISRVVSAENAEFTIADCNRQVTIDLSIDGYKPGKKSVKKLSKIIAFLERLREDMIAEIQR